MSNVNDSLSKIVLDDYEQEIEHALERGEFESQHIINESGKLLEEAAQRHLELNKAKPVTIRIKQMDLIKIKAKARRYNIPYQTLIGSIVHDFAEERKELTIK